MADLPNISGQTPKVTLRTNLSGTRNNAPKKPESQGPTWSESALITIVDLTHSGSIINSAATAEKNVVDGAIDLVKSAWFKLFSRKTEKARTEIEKAKEEEAAAVKAGDKAKEKAATVKMGDAARGGLLAAADAIAVKDPKAAARAAAVIRGLSDKEAVALFASDSKSMTEAKTEAAFNAAADKFAAHIEAYAGSGVKMALPVREVVSGAVKVMVKRFTTYIQANSSDIEAEAIKKDPSADGQATTQRVSTDTDKAAKVLTRVRTALASTEVAGAPEDAAQVTQAISQEQVLAARILQVAADKGYRLDNFDAIAALARGATETSATTEVVPADAGEYSFISRAKHIANTMLEDLNRLLRDNREANARKDNESFKATLATKAQERKDIEKEIEKKQSETTQQTKESVKIALSKLHIETIVLSYLLKNPDQASQLQLDTIRDEINKIRMQVVNNGH